MASDAKRMITGILFVFRFHLVIASDGGFWVESGGSLQFGVARERLTYKFSIVPIGPLLSYSSGSVTVAFSYAESKAPGTR
jgi:hypothetical protein